jgi:hypothetical protein
VRIVRVLAATAVAATLSSCGATHETEQDNQTPPAARDRAAPVYLDENSHVFYPRHAPRDGLTAQRAFNALLRDAHQAPKTIPARVTVRYGLLTDYDTVPPSDRTPVWGFTVKTRCRVTTDAAAGQCNQWDFVRALDGRALRGLFQQPVS